MSGTAAFALVLSSLITLAVPSVQAADPNWDASGAYVLNFNYNGADYAHNVTLAQGASGELSGNGGSGAYAWVIDSGSVSGDDISFTAHYTAAADAVAPLTVMSVTGTIAGGSMSGVWSDNYQGGARSGTWAAASGAASPIIVPVVRTITASAGAKGSITPSGAVSVADGADQAFAITPDAGFHVSDVLVDGASVGATTTYTFSAVAADHAISASFEVDAPAQASTTAASPNRRNGGSGRILESNTGSGEIRGAATGSGEVEGAETGPSGCANGPLIASFMRAGADNDQEQVKLLQAFLSGEMGTTTPATGMFDAQTEAAVRAFQLKYADEILAPWGITEPTGQVYLLTQWKINGIACPALNAPKPAVPPLSQSGDADEDIVGAAVAPVAGSVTLTDSKTDDNAVSASGVEPQVAAVAAASTTASSTPGLFGRFVNWLFGK